ncbi:MAG TPA: NAD(P)-dependent oxidoreductase [Flavitalea sp.]|nr:NAD(P)-dependent oxidoreductase [Flavitalea sp.]
MIAFLGTGLLGANFTRALLKKGEKVQVWNRTGEKAKALEAEGAIAFDDPASAVNGADRIHLTLSDDQSVEEVLQQASPGFRQGVIIVDHTTTSSPGAAKRSSYWKEKGFHYIHAPVFMGPPNALEGTGTMMVSGDQKVIKQIDPELSEMTGKLWNLGDDPSKAASIKLLGNLFHIGLVGVITDMFTLAETLNVPSADLHALFEILNPAGVAKARLKKIESKTFDEPSWELSMARKDARLMMEQAKSSGNRLLVIPPVAEKMDSWIKKGHSKDDWTILSQE